ncbi:MAG: hypothetical protein FWG83_08165 [Oscillospiraceae bacterium]|nr:hypothetical protein [Oscillospiraceae bacterium]
MKIEKTENRFITRKRIIIILIIIAVSALLELTLFNRAHYSHLWQGEKSTDFETVSMYYENGIYRRLPASEYPETAVFVFENLDRRVNSVYIEVVDTDPNPDVSIQSIPFSVIYGDEENSRKETQRFDVLVSPEFTRYQEINPYGNVDYIRIVPHNHDFAVKTVAVNVTIPFVFVWARFLIVAILAIGVYLLISCDVSKIVFNPESLYQQIAFLLIIFLFIGFANAVVSPRRQPPNTPMAPAYDRMAESLLEGRLDLEADPVHLKTLTTLSDPYNPAVRGEYGIRYWEFDNSYYDGKIYMQHGIGPALVLFLPYHILTGEHVPLDSAVYIFGSLAAVFLVLLWRRIVKHYFPGTSFVLFMCSTATVLWCSLIGTQFFWAEKHAVAVTAGLMFVSLGLWLLFSVVAQVLEAQKVQEAETIKIKATQYVRIFFGCFCVAFAVSCRASTALSSFLVPIILWPLIEKSWKEKRNRLKQLVPLALCVVIPYLAVALPLMWYNYARFESITEFGTGYAITEFNNTVITNMNPTALVRLFIESVRNLFFEPIKLRTTFPFVENTSPLIRDAASPHRHYNGHLGMISLPIFWSLTLLPFILRFRKNLRKQNRPCIEIPKSLARLSISMFSLGIFTGIMSYVLVASIIRYQVDYMFLLLFPALIVAYLAWEHFGRKSWFCKLLCAVCIVSALIALPLSSEEGPWFNLPRSHYAEIKRIFTFF